jgi:hypothetical protein
MGNYQIIDVEIPWRKIEDIYAFAVRRFGQDVSTKEERELSQYYLGDIILEAKKEKNEALEREKILQDKLDNIMNKPKKVAYIDGLQRALEIAGKTWRGKVAQDAIRIEIQNELLRLEQDKTTEKAPPKIYGIMEVTETRMDRILFPQDWII